MLETLAEERIAASEDAFRHWTAAMAGLGAWRPAMRSEFEPHTVVNLTPTLAAHLLTLYVGGCVPCRGSRSTNTASG